MADLSRGIATFISSWLEVELGNGHCGSRVGRREREGCRKNRTPNPFPPGVAAEAVSYELRRRSDRDLACRLRGASPLRTLY